MILFDIHSQSSGTRRRQGQRNILQIHRFSNIVPTDLLGNKVVIHVKLDRDIPAVDIARLTPKTVELVRIRIINIQRRDLRAGIERIE